MTSSNNIIFDYLGSGLQRRIEAQRFPVILGPSFWAPNDEPPATAPYGEVVVESKWDPDGGIVLKLPPELDGMLRLDADTAHKFASAIHRLADVHLRR